MRKLSLSIVVVLITLMACKAQNLLGFKAYGQFSSITSDSTPMKKSIKAEQCFGGGLIYKHFELGPIGFQGELTFEEKGFTINNTEDTYYTWRAKYVGLPLAFHVDIGKHAVKAVFALGVYGDLRLENPHIKTNCVDSFPGIEKIVNADFRRVSYGLFGEAGIAVDTKIGVFQVELRASREMGKMADLGEIALFNYISSRNVGLAFNYMIPFGQPKYSVPREKKVKPEKERKINKNDLENSNLDSIPIDSIYVPTPNKDVENLDSEVETDFDFAEPNNTVDEDNMPKGEAEEKKHKKN